MISSLRAVVNFVWKHIQVPVVRADGGGMSQVAEGYLSREKSCPDIAGTQKCFLSIRSQTNLMLDCCCANLLVTHMTVWVFFKNFCNFSAKPLPKEQIAIKHTQNFK